MKNHQKNTSKKSSRAGKIFFFLKIIANLFSIKLRKKIIFFGTWISRLEPKIVVSDSQNFFKSHYVGKCQDIKTTLEIMSISSRPHTTNTQSHNKGLGSGWGKNKYYNLCKKKKIINN
jgi:hypothetical protein